MNISFNQFLNPFDILFISTLLISIFFGIKNGFIKSLFNLIKWMIIFYTIKNCFTFLRPFFDTYINNQTVSDVFIFLFTFVVSYIFISFINRLIMGILQPKKSLFIDISFGGILGIIRGYIIFILLIFFINSNFSSELLSEFIRSGSFKEILDYGTNLLKQIPRNINEIQKLEI